jgi:hypothetical protein
MRDEQMPGFGDNVRFATPPLARTLFPKRWLRNADKPRDLSEWPFTVQRLTEF